MRDDAHDHPLRSRLGRRSGPAHVDVVHLLMKCCVRVVGELHRSRNRGVVRATDGKAVHDQMLRASCRAFGPTGERIGRQMAASVRGTVNGLVLVGLGEGALMGVAYVIAGHELHHRGILKNKYGIG